MNFSSVYKNKKVFVTGHTGFKGSWLISWLHLLGADVKGYALSPVNDCDLFNVIKGETLCHSVIADIRDNQRLRHELISFNPDFVFHLAAQPLVIESYNDPLYTYEVNAIGTANLLDALRFLDKPCVAVMITTDKVYQNDETGRPFIENDRLGGYDPYSGSKAATEVIIDSYRKSLFNPNNYERHFKSISVGRAGNVIGGGDWSKNRIIPDIVNALVADKPIQVRNPKAVRPWQHVLEPLNGYLNLASKQLQDPVKFADAYNFGPELSDNLSVEDIVKEAIRIWGKGNYEVTNLNKDLHEADLLQLDIKKAKDQLNWYPRYSATEAIDKTLKWYTIYFQNKSNVLDHTLNNIKLYDVKK